MSNGDGGENTRGERSQGTGQEKPPSSETEETTYEVGFFVRRVETTSSTPPHHPDKPIG